MIVRPARKPNESLGSSAGGGPAGVGVAQRESRSPVWPLRQLLQGENGSPLPINAFIFTDECVFLCVYFLVASNSPAGTWSNYQSGSPRSLEFIYYPSEEGEYN